jgi:transcription elongation GreA/GreB family factor
VVSVGTVVYAADLEANKEETFTILGAWDSDPEKGVISYLSPVAQALLNKAPGDQVVFDVHGEKHHHRIVRIDPYKPTADAAPAPAESHAASKSESAPVS